MTSILDFLGLDGFRNASRGSELVAEYAKEAAHNFLKNGVPLNDTIVKIAQTEALTPETVEMVVWEANKTVHASKFASQADKYVEFPLADAAFVMKSLQVDRPSEAKLASAVSNDFDLPPVDTTGTSRDFELSKTASGMHEGLTGPGAQPLKYRAAVAQEKLASARHELEADLAGLQARIRGNEVTLMKEARAAVLDYPFESRIEAFAALTKVAAAVQIKPTIMQKLAEVLVRQGLMEKTACLEDLISDEIARKCQVINGNHRLYVLFKTLKEDYDRRDALTDRWNVVRSEQTILDEKMRLL